MNQAFDVVILGGGVIGCSTAYHLAKKGRKVLVLDKRTVGGQASGVAAGMLAAQEEAQAPDVFFDLCLASGALFKTLVPEVQAASGIDPEWETCGVWRVAENEEEVPALMEKKRWQEERGLPVEWHGPDRLRDVLPGLSPSIGALYCPTDGQINTVKWVQALAEAARRVGVRFRDHVPQAGLVHVGNQITGVRTKTEMYFTEKVVVAAGAWTPAALTELGVSLPLEPVKGQLMVLAGLPRAFRGPVYAGAGYLVPRRDGRLIIGATAEKAGFNTQPTMAAQRVLAAWAERWCPGLSSLPLLEFQVGLRPGSPDGRPVMGPLPGWEGLYVAGGHYRNGILLSPITGQFMADGVAEGRWADWGKPFSPDRFSAAPVGPAAS